MDMRKDMQGVNEFSVAKMELLLAMNVYINLAVSRMEEISSHHQNHPSLSTAIL